MTQTITKIEAQKRKGRFNVYVDGQYAFPISEEVFIKYRVFKGMEVDDKLIDTLKNADNISKIHSRALNYLAHNLRTEYEVREKLADITEDEDAIDKVIDILADQTLIDDQRYADSYVRTVVRERKNGPDWIRRHLKDKRVEANYVENSLDHYYPEQDVLEIGVEVAKKQLKKYKRDSAKMAVNKTKELLMRRGFPYGDIEEIMNQTDTSEMAEQDHEVIDKVAEKYFRQYSRLEPYKRKQKIKQALYRKGFLMDDITIAMAKLENK
jgi:regulatory protein